MQPVRSQLFLQLDGLTELADAEHFFEALADVATLHARTGREADRERWRWLAAQLTGCLERT